MSTAVRIHAEIIRKNEFKQIVYGAALVPDREDTQGDIVTKEDVEEAAHGFLINMQEVIFGEPSVIGLQHQVFKSIGYVVESYIDPDSGSWILGTKVADAVVWDKIMKGEITGYSIGGLGERIPL